ncbi:DHHA1 domain-containing protein [Paenibacillus sp.]|uniref:alanyl-tRNA editing protein n=1 Tax=Paenibacillus sp. TaxID=58172 RepID=UPI002810C0D1|nr:DHHA1 domain-containing protein [Paenibacillus sp.]
MTKRLYYDTAYLTEWGTHLSKTLRREDGWYVALAESAFYPHGGGQPCDYGTIDGIPVLDVISEEDEVLHKVERLPEGAAVLCRIDWRRRFDHMQQHSGQHLLSAVCLRLYGAMTVSFHLGADSATIDVELPELSPERLAALEREANDVVFQNRAIASYVVSGEAASRLPLVKPPKVTGDVRIVEIEGVEYNACGGTHVSATGGIGLIKLLRAEKQKGCTRITFKCGFRALEEFNAGAAILGRLSATFNAGKDAILDRFAKWEEEQRQLQKELAELKEKHDAYVARELLERRDDGVIAVAFEDKPLKDLQGLAGKVAAMTDVPVLLADRAGSKVVLAHGGRFGLACGAFVKEHAGAYRGKGGGSATLAQAGFGSWDEAAAFFAFAKRTFKA